MAKKKFNVFNGVTNVDNISDIEKTLQYFKANTGTTLDCMLSTGILRNSITYYVTFLENNGLLQVVFIGRDQCTGRKAKFYSGDSSKWKKPIQKELSLFDSFDFEREEG